MRNLIIFIAVIFGAGQAWAQEGTPIIANMTMDELRNCAATAEGLRARQSSLHDEDVRLYDVGRGIKRESFTIDASRAKINIHDGKQIADFNSRVAKMNESATKYNQSIRTKNSEASRISDDINSFNVMCANRPYNDADIAALPPGQQAAIRAGARRMEIPLLYSPNAQDPNSPASESGNNESSSAFVIGTSSPAPAASQDASQESPGSEAKSTADETQAPAAPPDDGQNQRHYPGFGAGPVAIESLPLASE
jgi:hypothetical protein